MRGALSRPVAVLDALAGYEEWRTDLPVEPLRVRARTATAVAVRDLQMLDGLLAFAVVRECLAGQPFPILPGAPPVWIPVPLGLADTVHGLPVWQATVFRPVGGGVPFETHYHRRADANIYALPAIRATLGERRPRRQPNSAAGQYMHYRIPERRIAAREWEASCIGNRNEVERLLGMVSGIGPGRTRGCGEVVAWTVEPLDAPFTLECDGAPLRPLPTTDGSGVLAGWTPPYWRRDLHLPCREPRLADCL